jgi:hypothetical protein
MRNTFWAEWIVARLTDRSRAASIIGDLLEAAGEDKTLWFWWSVTGVVLSFVWPSLVAFVAAFVCFSALARAWFSMNYPAHMPPQIWTPFFSVFGLLYMAAPYALVRYGFRDRFAQLTVALCAPMAAVLFCWWIPAVVLPCIALVLSIVTFSGAFVSGRRALLVLAAALAFGYGGIRFTLHLADRYLELASPSLTRTVVVRGLPPILWVAIPTTACELTHCLLMRRDHE